MKKLEKEAVLRERMILISAVSFFIFILPYIFHLALNGIQPADAESFGQIHQTVLIEVGAETEVLQLEAYLVGALAKSCEVSCHDETLKAMAVVLRSNAVSTITDGRSVARESFYTEEELHILWGSDYEENIRRYREIITSTEGIVLFFDGEIVEVPFHKISAGETRDSDILTQYLPYVTSVESADDMYADGYFSSMAIKKDVLGEDFAVLTQDRFGYAVSVKVHGEEMNGEKFCGLYGLQSACFDYDVKEDFYVFYVRGSGHGFGLSIYGADAMAKKGSSFAEILEYFYPGIEIQKENRSDIEA